MRVGIDARFYSGESSKGLGRYTEKLLHYLHPYINGYQFVVFCQPDAVKRVQTQLPKAEVIPADAKWYSLEEQLKMPKIIDTQELDLVHIPHFNVPLRLKTPFVVTIHDLILTRYPTKRATTLGPLMYAGKQAAYRTVIRHAVQKSEAIITVSQFSKTDIVNTFSVDPEKVHVTYEAADTPALWPIPADVHRVRNTYGLDGKYVLYVGNAYPHKNLDIIIDVVKRWDGCPVQFVLVGKEDYFYKRLKEAVTEAGLEDRIIFTGFAPDADLYALYKGAAAYFFPSKYEGFGLPPLEAMLVGTPVVSANTSSLPEVLRDGAKYFEPEDVYGIINAIDSVLNIPGFAATLAKKGREVATSYSWKQLARDTLRIYEQTARTRTKT